MSSFKAFAVENATQFKQNNLQPQIVNKNLKLSDVVQFYVLKLDPKKLTIQLSLETQNGFKIYADKLKFYVFPKGGLQYEIPSKPEIKAQKILDPFYNQEKYFFENGNGFNLSSKTKFKFGDKIHIEVQACSQNVCMLPNTLSINIKKNAVSELLSPVVFYKESNLVQNISSVKSITDSNLNTNMEVNATLKGNTNSLDRSILSVNSNLSYFLQNAFRNGSLILFPALFLAGLLMNLTPCVYPMIPITLSVMTQFEKKDTTAQEKKKRKYIFPLIYVGAMVLVYSFLGVFAGMTGNIFGSQFSSPLFSVLMALFMFLFGFAMLGLFNLAKVQTFAVKIPLAKNNPALAVATMGAVSGLVSAPCTGPVLSMILVLIAQNKDPFSGFLYMMFFAVGFGAPYVALGILSQKIMKMPKFPRIIELVKLFFSALMFSLGFYFLKSIIRDVAPLQFLYLKPSEINLILFSLTTLIFLVLAKKRNMVGKICHLGALICLFFLCMWLTLWVTNSFVENSVSKSESLQEILKKSPIVWYTKYEEALTLAHKNHKPILVDIWADWCVACLEMEKTTWKNPNIVKILNEKYIPIKLDYSMTSQNVDLLLDKWNIMGLPAVVLFNKDVNVNSANSPSRVFQGIVSDDVLLQRLGEY